MRTFYVIAKVTIHDPKRDMDESDVATYVECALDRAMSENAPADGVIDLSAIDPEKDKHQCRDLERMLSGPDWAHGEED